MATIMYDEKGGSHIVDPKMVSNYLQSGFRFSKSSVKSDSISKNKDLETEETEKAEMTREEAISFLKQKGVKVRSNATDASIQKLLEGL